MNLISPKNENLFTKRAPEDQHIIINGEVITLLHDVILKYSAI